MAVTTVSAQTKSSPGGNKQTAAQSSKPIYRNTKYSFRERAADLSGARLQFKSSSPSVPAVSSGGVLGSTVIIVKND